MQFRRMLVPSTLIVCILMMLNLNTHLAKAWGDEPALSLVWQTKFTSDSALSTPVDVAVDGWGNSFVSSQGTNSIKKFDSEGNFVTQWGDTDQPDGNFSLAFGIAIDADNNVYVSDFNNKRIKVFDNNGKFLRQWASEPSTSPAFLAVDAQGNVFTDEFPPHDDHFIQKFDKSGKLVTEWGGKTAEFSTRIEDIVLDKDGNLYVADPIAHRVQKLDWSGKVLATFGGKASTDGNGLFNDPFGIAVDAKGNIFVLDSNFLQKLGPDGKMIAQWSTKGGDLDRATNVALDTQGNLYVFARADVTGVNGKAINVFVLKKFSQS